MLVISN